MVNDSSQAVIQAIRKQIEDVSVVAGGRAIRFGQIRGGGLWPTKSRIPQDCIAVTEVPGQFAPDGSFLF